VEQTSFKIEDVFKITDKGIVIMARIDKQFETSIGDNITFKCSGKTCIEEINGVEYIREGFLLHNPPVRKDRNVGILITCDETRQEEILKGNLPQSIATINKSEKDKM
jgi:translation elongation factor EF-Tu-like GTPase